MFLLIDNYDSFTFNLYHYLGDLGVDCEVVRNDKISPDEAIAKKPDAIVLSPGPCDPPRAGICVDLIKCAAVDSVPLLGVCLGHQSIAYAFGGVVERGPVPMHGKVSEVLHDGRGLFAGLPSPLRSARYHSLIVAEQLLPECLEVTARTDDGVVMGLQHRELPMHGVQFHPESIASDAGHDLLRNFIDATRH
ncbi:MAG: aminodeoxychorismate/anthranilate synthase component II [Alphaproteobacteria bacterium]